MSAKGLCRFVSRRRTLAFQSPKFIVTATETDEVLPALRRVAEGVARGLCAAGYVAYEAAPAFDAALVAHPPSGGALLWFGLYADATEYAGLPVPGEEAPSSLDWAALISESAYRRAMARIREWIAAGDTYQVNYAFALEAAFAGDPENWFARLCHAQRAEYGAFLDVGDGCIVSASPELFFRLDGNRIETRPMKGTRPRGLWFEADRRAALDLAASPKDRAENIMIVDLLRNDLGRIADAGSVRVEALFEVEQYPTVWQMTSTIAAQTRADVPEIFAALFPCGSVTGAPKVRTMQIIREVEPHPRGAYCGAIGWWMPCRRAEFSVGIRTMTVDRCAGTARYAVGSGVTWDSEPQAEYAECRAKAAVLDYCEPSFQLIESFRHARGYWLLDEHMARLEESAAYFGFVYDRAEVARLLQECALDLYDVPMKVRLLLSRDGGIVLERFPLPEPRPLRIGWAKTPIDRRNRFFYHKTTMRSAYDAAAAERPDCDDVVLFNDRDEITETTIANIAVEMEEAWWTPPVACGLLNGAFRRNLLATGILRERVFTRREMAHAAGVRLYNSVRGWMPAIFIDV